MPAVPTTKMSDKLLSLGNNNNNTKYAQNARFVGRKPVTGPLNDLSLAHVVSELQAEARKSSQLSGNHHGPAAVAEELRCNLEFSDKHLLVTYIKKDEGFESDGESTKSNEAVKIVFHDDTSSANSSGSDCDDLNSSTTQNTNNAKQSSTSTSASASPTSDLAKYKFDHKESYNIHDVLICHTLAGTNNVVWVMRCKTGLEAMVIECSSEEEVKPLYKKFLDLSKRSKLERHRRRKSDGGSVVTRSMEAIFNGGGLRKREKSLEDEDRAGGTNNSNSSATNRFSLVQHTDRNGITHIEVEQPKSYIEKASEHNQGSSSSVIVDSTTNTSSNNTASNTTSVPKPVMGPSQQLVAKLRSSRSSAGTPGKKPAAASEKSKFAKELESILSKELEARQTEHYRRTRPPGESLSLRQRAPALLLRKLDEFEEKANQLWAKAEAEEENRKIWNKPTVVIDPSKLATRTPPPRAKLSSTRSVEVNQQRKERLNRIKAELLGDIRPPVQQQQHHHHQSSVVPNLNNSNNIALQAASVTTATTTSAAAAAAAAASTASTPPTPTITTTAASTPNISKKEIDNQNNLNKSQILVPTKTGKEPVKKLYPKDQVVPEFLHHNRGGPPTMGHVAGHPPGGPHSGPRFMLALPSPMQFTAQPHSLPLYPVTMAPMPPWAHRYTTASSMVSAGPQSGDFNDSNNNMGHQVWAAIPVHRPAMGPAGVPPAVMADNPRGRSRDRSRGAMDPEQRRRAQSKSPARHAAAAQPGGMPHHTADHHHHKDLSGGLTRKFREFGDAVRQRISRRSGTANITVNHNQDSPDGQLLKSNLKKKNNVNNSSGSGGDETSSGNGTSSSNLDTNNDNKKVHFNKFATVQMME